MTTTDAPPPADKKNAIQSLTIIGLLILVFGMVRDRLGLHVTDAEIDSWVTVSVNAVGALLTLYGRWRKGDLTLGVPVWLILALLIPACTPLTTTLTDSTKAETLTTPASNARMDADGNLTASFQGVPPTNLMTDRDGSWLTTPGEGGAVAVVLPNGVTMYSWSPKDGEIDSLIFTTQDGDRLEVRGMKFNLSDVARVRMEQFALAMTAIQGMTAEQARVEIQRLVTLGEVTENVAAAALKAFVPVP